MSQSKVNLTSLFAESAETDQYQLELGPTPKDRFPGHVAPGEPRRIWCSAKTSLE